MNPLISCRARFIAWSICVARLTSTYSFSRFIIPSLTGGAWESWSRISSQLHARHDGIARPNAAGWAKLYHVGRGRSRDVATRNFGRSSEILENKSSGARRMWNDPITAGPPLRWRTKIPAAGSNKRTDAPDGHHLVQHSARCIPGRFLRMERIRRSGWNACGESQQTKFARDDGVLRRHRPPARRGRSLAKMSEHLRTGHRLTIDAFANAIPFVELVHALSEKTTTGYNPLFEVRFALQNHPMPEVSLPNLSAKLSMRSTGTPVFNLPAKLPKSPEAWKLCGFFGTTSFPNVTSKLSMAYFKTFWRALVARPNHGFPTS